MSEIFILKIDKCNVWQSLPGNINLKISIKSPSLSFCIHPKYLKHLSCILPDGGWVVCSWVNMLLCFRRHDGRESGWLVDIGQSFFKCRMLLCINALLYGVKMPDWGNRFHCIIFTHAALVVVTLDAQRVGRNRTVQMRVVLIFKLNHQLWFQIPALCWCQKKAGLCTMIIARHLLDNYKANPALPPAPPPHQTLQPWQAAAATDKMCPTDEW